MPQNRRRRISVRFCLPPIWHGLLCPVRSSGRDVSFQKETEEKPDEAAQTPDRTVYCLNRHPCVSGGNLPPPRTPLRGSKAPAESFSSFSGAVLKDGIYEGTSEGYRGDVTVSVTVQGCAVTEISVTGQNETPQYYARAEGIIDSILSSQSLEVDGVTGATLTSKAI